MARVVFCVSHRVPSPYYLYIYIYIPRNLRTHILRLLGPKTILYKALGLF